MDPQQDSPPAQNVDPPLSSQAEEKETVVVLKSGNLKVKKPEQSIKSYDFRQPLFLSSNQMRKLRLHQEDFIRALAAKLSIFLRLEFTLLLSKIEILNFNKFAETLASPTCLTLFKLESLRGIGMVEIQNRLALTIVDRLLGGPGQAHTQSHELSEIESALLDQITQVVLSEWCRHWNSSSELNPVLLAHETQGRFLQPSPQDQVLLVLTLGARFGDCAEQIQIALPFHTIEPIIKNTFIEMHAPPQAHTPPPKPQPMWNPALNDTKIALTAQFKNLTLTGRQIAQLKIGDVLQLDPETVRHVQVLIAGKPKFKGQLGSSNKHWAVQLSPISN